LKVRKGLKSVAFHTLGCKVNAYETEAMQKELADAGYEIRSFGDTADVYVVNTCSVTNIADRKSRQMLHRAKALNPDAVVVAAGCYAQGAKDTLKEDLAVDIILGNHEKRDIARVLAEYFDGGSTPEVAEIGGVRDYDEFSTGGSTDHTRAFLKIQDGCNQFCSYCIIPYVRGRVRSRRPEEILLEAERFAEKGYREIVLTGIHLSSYGIDFRAPADAADDAPRGGDYLGADGVADAFSGIAGGTVLPGTGADAFSGSAGEAVLPGTGAGEIVLPGAGRNGIRGLGGVLRMLDHVPGIERIRIGSLEPRLITDGFVEMLSGLSHICPHFHLSLQSGSDSVLKRMNRHYTTEEYARGVERLRAAFPDAALTTDVICGFPGETEEEFAESCAFVRETGFYEMHIFPYSVRKGTRAAAMPGQVTKAVKAERAARLAVLEREMSREFRERRIGCGDQILTEDIITAGGKEWLAGNTKEYVKVGIDPSLSAGNRLVKGTITGFLTDGIMKMDRIVEIS